MTRIGRAWPVLVLGVALAVRVWGIGWQLPAALYFDEMKYVDRAGAMVRGQPPDSADFRNPTLFRHLLEVEYRLANLAHPSSDIREAAVLQLGLARVTSAILGALACLLTGLAAARLPNLVSPGWTGLATGLILALAPLEVHLSHYAVNDAPASFVMAACLLFGARALAAPNSLDLLLAGVLAGLAAATKYNFGVVLVLPLAAAVGPAVVAWGPALHTLPWGPALHTLPWGPSIPTAPQPPLPVRGRGGDEEGGADEGAASHAPTQLAGRGGACPTRWRVRAARYLVLTLSGFALGLGLGMPEILTSPGLVTAGIAEQARLGSIRWNGQTDAPVWHLYGEALVKGLGWPVLLVAVGGAIMLWRRDRLSALAVLAVPGVCLAIMLRQELFFARFALPLLPPLALLGGVGISGLADWAGRRPGPAVSVAMTLLVLALVLVPATLATVRHDQLASTTDTRILAQRWLEDRAGGARVVTEVYGLPISWTGTVPPHDYRLQRVASLVDPAGVRRLACDGVRYFVQASLTSEREVARRSAFADGSGYDLLARSGQIAATFDPFWPGLQAPAHPDDTGIPFWYQAAYERPGPKITIFEVPDGAIPCTP